MSSELIHMKYAALLSVKLNCSKTQSPALFKPMIPDQLIQVHTEAIKRGLSNTVKE